MNRCIPIKLKGWPNIFFDFQIIASVLFIRVNFLSLLSFTLFTTMQTNKKVTEE